MIIFFDWENESDGGGLDGLPDHVGIVEKVENGRVYTIEGNTTDSCRGGAILWAIMKSSAMASPTIKKGYCPIGWYPIHIVLWFQINFIKQRRIEKVIYADILPSA